MEQEATTTLVTVLLDKVFTPYYNTVRKLEARAATRAYDLLVPGKMRKRMNKLPDNYFAHTVGVRFVLKYIAAPDDGPYSDAVYHLSLETPVKLPEFIARGVASVIDDADLRQWTAEFTVMDTAYYNDRAKMCAELRALCALCRSSRALTSAWPEMENYINGTAVVPKGADVVEYVQKMFAQITQACTDINQREEEAGKQSG